MPVFNGHHTAECFVSLYFKLAQCFWEFIAGIKQQDIGADPQTYKTKSIFIEIIVFNLKRSRASFAA